MTDASKETERRRNAALSAIKTTLGSLTDQYGATLFVSHHLAELDAKNWKSSKR